MSRESVWAVAASYDAAYKAEMAAAQLQTAGIPYRLDRKGAVGLFGPGFGGTSVRGVDLLVPRSKLEDARELIGVTHLRLEED